jgi:hypothetical protein
VDRTQVEGIYFLYFPLFAFERDTSYFSKTNLPHCGIKTCVMKKIFIGSLVGGIILFIWSFIAWGVSPMHLHTFMYTPAQTVY